MQEYSCSEIYREIIHFMDSTYPKWNSNKGIGFWAAEFVLNSIYNLKHLEDQFHLNTPDKLKEIYLYLKESYNESKASFVFVLSDTINIDFEKEYLQILEDNSELSEFEYAKLYEKLYFGFKAMVMKKVTYTFEK